MMTQQQMYRRAVSISADIDRTFLDMVNHPTHPLTSAELVRLIDKRPALWGRFANWIEVLS
jgi:hypothetical protein